MRRRRSLTVSLCRYVSILVSASDSPSATSLSQSDALSVARSKFLAVDHAIRVTVYASTGMLGLAMHLSVTLPIRVVSMLSVDPPTSVTSPDGITSATHDRNVRPNGSSGELRPHHSELGSRTDSPPPYRRRLPSLEQPRNSTVSSRYTYHLSLSLALELNLCIIGNITTLL